MTRIIQLPSESIVENPHSFQTAVKFRYLQNEHNLSGAEIASRIGVEKTVVNSLIRFVSPGVLHEDIINAWRDKHPAATFANLQTLVHKSHDEQLKKWRKLITERLQ